MGGDKGPNAVMGGINQFLYQNGEEDVFFRLFGDEKKLRKLLSKYPRVARNCEIIHAPKCATSDTAKAASKDKITISIYKKQI